MTLQPSTSKDLRLTDVFVKPIPVYACGKLMHYDTIYTYLIAVQAKPRFIFSHQGKIPTLCIAFWFEIWCLNKPLKKNIQNWLTKHDKTIKGNTGRPQDLFHNPHFLLHYISLFAHCSLLNFINILCVCFSYESALRSFSLITVWLCDFLAKGYRRKKRL